MNYCIVQWNITDSACHASQEEMLKEAEALVAERRTPEVAAVRTEQGREGVFAWAGGPPRAGEAAVLAYNKACGALRCSITSVHSPAWLSTSG